MTINKAFWCHVPNMICGGPEVIKNSIRDSKQLNFLAPLLASPLISYLSSPLLSSHHLVMKLSLAVGILSSQTLPVLLEARVLSNTKLDSDDPPRSSDQHEPPVLRGRKQLVGSTATHFKTTTTSLLHHRQTKQQHQQQLVSKKAIE